MKPWLVRPARATEGLSLCPAAIQGVSHDYHRVGVKHGEAVVGQPCERVRLHDVSCSHPCDGAERSETVVSQA